MSAVLEPLPYASSDKILRVRTSATRATADQRGPAVLLLGRVNPELSVISPIALSVELDEGEYILSDELFFVYGVGLTPRDALRDYAVSLADYHRMLLAEPRTEPVQRQIEQLLRYVRIDADQSP